MTDLYWDEVLLTNNPDSKELEVSFKKIDGEGFLLSQGDETGTPGGVIQGTDGAQSPELDDEGDFETIVPPIDGDVEPEGTPIPPSSPADECGGYDCDAFVESVLSEDLNLNWHLWPTKEEVEELVQGPDLEDDFGNILSDIYYYRTARGDITNCVAEHDTASTNVIDPKVVPYPLRSDSNLRPCNSWARKGSNSFRVGHDIEGYQSNNILTAFQNPSVGANRAVEWDLEWDINWYWEFGEDVDDFDTLYAPNIGPNEKIYVAPSYVPTLWKAFGNSSERVQIFLDRPAFKLYPYGGKVEVGRGGSGDSSFTEVRPAVGTDLYPISGWYSMKVKIEVLTTPDPQFVALQNNFTVYTCQLSSPMGIFTDVRSGSTRTEHASPVLVRDWGLVGGLGVTVYSSPAYYPENGLLIATSTKTVDLRTKDVVERLRQGYTPPTYCSRIP